MIGKLFLTKNTPVKIWTLSCFLTSLLILFIPRHLPADIDDNFLHVQSPDWREQIIYFILTDRFYDGDPGNNHQGKDDYAPDDSRKYSGGDLQGIIEKIEYIKGLGASAIWITPPIANQWWDGQVGYGGYHGYWAINFKQVDAHQGTLKTYKKLSRALHKQGMYLIQDIVVNHVGNFFTYRGKYHPTDPTRNFVLNTKTSPTQYPFNMNDISNPLHRSADIYHWTPCVKNYQDEQGSKFR